MFSKTFDRGMR